MLRSEQLEREAEIRRTQLEETFDELRARVTPGHVLDQLVDYASDSGGRDFFRNLRDQTVANPLALGIVGAGLAWLMLSNGREPRRRASYRGRIRRYFAGAREGVGNAAAGARDRFADAAQRASDAAGSVGDTARTARNAAFETASNWRDAAGSAASSLRDAASSGYEQARSRVSDTRAALGGAASAVYGGASTVYGGVAHSAGRTAAGMKTFARGAASTSQDMLDFCRDQPLVLAGLGIALGAAVGAVLPSTETEDQLMGETSDELKERTRDFAKAQYDRSKSTAENVLDEVQHRVRESSQPLAGQPSIVPSGSEGEIGEMRESARPEPIGPRDGRS